MAGEVLEQLPTDLKTHEAITSLSPNTVGDIAKAYVAQGGKLKEFEGKLKESEGKITDLTKKLSVSMPKELPADATPEEKETYHIARGRPEKPEGYEFTDPVLEPIKPILKEAGVSEDLIQTFSKNNPEFVNVARAKFFEMGLSAEHQKMLVQWYNGIQVDGLKKMAEEGIRTRKEAEVKLKTEYGEKYDRYVELTKRVWKNYTNSEFETWVNQKGVGNDPTLLRFMFEICAKTGEDRSMSGGPMRKVTDTSSGAWFPNSPVSPTGR